MLSPFHFTVSERLTGEIDKSKRNAWVSQSVPLIHSIEIPELGEVRSTSIMSYAKICILLRNELVIVDRDITIEKRRESVYTKRYDIQRAT